MIQLVKIKIVQKVVERNLGVDTPYSFDIGRRDGRSLGGCRKFTYKAVKNVARGYDACYIAKLVGDQSKMYILGLELIESVIHAHAFGKVYRLTDDIAELKPLRVKREYQLLQGYHSADRALGPIAEHRVGVVKIFRKSVLDVGDCHIEP